MGTRIFSRFVKKYFTHEEAVKHTTQEWKERFLTHNGGHVFVLFQQVTSPEEQDQLILDIHHLMDVIIQLGSLCPPSKYGNRMFRTGKFRFFNPDNEFMPIAKKTGVEPCDSSFSHYNEAFWFSRTPLTHYMFNPKFDVQSDEHFGTITGLHVKDKSDADILNFVLDLTSRTNAKVPGNQDGILCSKRLLTAINRAIAVPIARTYSSQLAYGATSGTLTPDIIFSQLLDINCDKTVSGYQCDEKYTSTGSTSIGEILDVWNSKTGERRSTFIGDRIYVQTLMDVFDVIENILYVLGNTPDHYGVLHPILSHDFITRFGEADEALNPHQIHLLGLFISDCPMTRDNQQNFPNEYIIKLSDFNDKPTRRNLFRRPHTACHARVYYKTVTHPSTLGYRRLEWFPSDGGEPTVILNKGIYDSLPRPERVARRLSMGGGSEEEKMKKISEIMKKLIPPDSSVKKVDQEIKEFYARDSGTIQDVDMEFLNKNMLDATNVSLKQIQEVEPMEAKHNHVPLIFKESFSKVSFHEAKSIKPFSKKMNHRNNKNRNTRKMNSRNRHRASIRSVIPA